MAKAKTQEKQGDTTSTTPKSRRETVLASIAQARAQLDQLEAFIQDEVSNDITIHGKHAPTTIVSIANRLNGILTNLEVANHITRYILPTQENGRVQSVTVQQPRARATTK